MTTFEKLYKLQFRQADSDKWETRDSYYYVQNAIGGAKWISYLYNQVRVIAGEGTHAEKIYFKKI